MSRKSARACTDGIWNTSKAFSMRATHPTPLSPGFVGPINTGVPNGQSSFITRYGSTLSAFLLYTVQGTPLYRTPWYVQRNED